MDGMTVAGFIVGWILVLLLCTLAGFLLSILLM